MKACIRCNIVKDSVDYSEGRNVCKVCRRIIANANIEKKKDAGDTNATKKCKTCEIDKNVNDFEVNRKECRTCITKKRSIACQSSKINKLPCKEPPSQCSKCSKTVQEGARFRWRTDQVEGNYRNECMDCYNLRKDYEKYREKKKNEDINAYRLNNAKVMKIWVKKNPEKVQEQKNIGKICPERKIKAVISYCKSKNVAFNEADREEMKNKLSENCHYCDYKGELLNGLDRVNPVMVYNNQNTVPCCPICNCMKCTTNVDDFILNIRKVHKHLGAPECNVRREIAYFCGRKELREAEVKTKTDYLTPRERANLWEQPCYLCGEPNSNGVDRFDSNGDYTIENSKPCCKTCNYMKKDLDYEDFKSHICHIYNKTKLWATNNNKSTIQDKQSTHIACINDKQEILCVFPGLRSISKLLKVSVQAISKAVNNNTRCNGYNFLYIDEDTYNNNVDKPKDIILNANVYKAIAAISNSSGDLLAVFSSIAECIEILQIRNASLSKAVQNSTKCCGHIWKRITSDEYEAFGKNTEENIKTLLNSKRK